MRVLDFPTIRIPEGEIDPFTLFEAVYYDKNRPLNWGPALILDVKGIAPRPGTYYSEEKL